jgi:predicted RNA-binding protein YlxR (DUF448 family)
VYRRLGLTLKSKLGSQSRLRAIYAIVRSVSGQKSGRGIYLCEMMDIVGEEKS